MGWPPRTLVRNRTKSTDRATKDYGLGRTYALKLRGDAFRRAVPGMNMRKRQEGVMTSNRLEMQAATEANLGHDGWPGGGVLHGIRDRAYPERQHWTS